MEKKDKDMLFTSINQSLLSWKERLVIVFWYYFNNKKITKLIDDLKLGFHIKYAYKNAKDMKEVKSVIRRGRPVFVIPTKVSDIDVKRLSHKFLTHNFPGDMIVNVKCDKNGKPITRGKQERYSIVVEDKLN